MQVSFCLVRAKCMPYEMMRQVMCFLIFTNRIQKSFALETNNQPSFVEIAR